MTVLIDYPADYSHLLNQAQIENSVLATLIHQGISAKSDLSILIDDDAHIQRLNREFMGIDAPTDVLAFPAGHQDPDTNHIYLGDVIISYPTANKQALLIGHSTSSEINLLVIHGVLHLVGHDHQLPEEKNIMWSAQDEILNSLGLDIKSPEFSTKTEE